MAKSLPLFVGSFALLLFSAGSLAVAAVFNPVTAMARYECGAAARDALVLRFQMVPRVAQTANQERGMGYGNRFLRVAGADDLKDGAMFRGMFSHRSQRRWL